MIVIRTASFMVDIWWLGASDTFQTWYHVLVLSMFAIMGMRVASTVEEVLRIQSNENQFHYAKPWNKRNNHHRGRPYLALRYQKDPGARGRNRRSGAQAPQRFQRRCFIRQNRIEGEVIRLECLAIATGSESARISHEPYRTRDG